MLNEQKEYLFYKINFINLLNSTIEVFSHELTDNTIFAISFDKCALLLVQGLYIMSCKRVKDVLLLERLASPSSDYHKAIEHYISILKSKEVLTQQDYHIKHCVKIPLTDLTENARELIDRLKLPENHNVSFILKCEDTHAMPLF